MKVYSDIWKYDKYTNAVLINDVDWKNKYQNNITQKNSDCHKVITATCTHIKDMFWLNIGNFIMFGTYCRR